MLANEKACHGLCFSSSGWELDGDRGAACVRTGFATAFMLIRTTISADGSRLCRAKETAVFVQTERSNRQPTSFSVQPTSFSVQPTTFWV